MNRILTTYGASGQPFTSPTSLDHLQDAIYQGFKDTLKGIIGPYFDANTPYAIWGCYFNPAGPLVTEGAIFFQNEIWAVDGWNPGFSCGVGTVPVLGTVTSWAATDPLDYKDGSSHNTHRIRKIAAGCAVSGSTDVCDAADLRRIPGGNMRTTVVATDATAAAPTYDFGQGGVFTYTDLGAGPTFTLDTSNPVAGTEVEIYTTGASGTVISLSTTIATRIVTGPSSLTLSTSGDVCIKMKYYHATNPLDRFISIEIQN